MIGQLSKATALTGFTLPASEPVLTRTRTGACPACRASSLAEQSFAMWMEIEGYLKDAEKQIRAIRALGAGVPTSSLGSSASEPKRTCQGGAMMPSRNVQLACIQTLAAIRASSGELVRLEDDLHDIVDRLRASEQMIQESRRLLERMNRTSRPNALRVRFPLSPTAVLPRRR